MTLGKKGFLTIIFGFIVAGGGIFRFVEANSTNALGFCLTIFVLAVIAGFLFGKEKRLPGLILAWIAVAFVGGFYISKAIGGELNTRVLILIACALLEGVILLLPSPPAQE